MMNIKIATVYKTENCGSFLQAYSLQEVCRKLGHKVSFAPYNDYLVNFPHRIFERAKCVIKGRFGIEYYLRERHNAFIYMRKKYLCTASMKEDVLVVGSDTLWNFMDPFFVNKEKYFLGEGCKSPKVSYAVSVGSSTLDDLRKIPMISNKLLEFKTISVRDGYSQGVVSELINKEVPVVLDPTMLLGVDAFNRMIENPQYFEKNFIFIYYFGRMPDDLAKEVLDFSTTNKIPCICFGNTADKRFKTHTNSSPDAFLYYFKNASYIVTNTFHGCIFSMLYHKKFVAECKNKQKMIELLNDFSFVDRKLDDYGKLINIIEQDIDYERFEKQLVKKREDSLNFLRSAIELIENKGSF